MPRKHHTLSRRIYQRQASKLTQEEYMKWVELYAEFFRLLRLFYRQKLAVETLVVMGEQDYVFLKAARSFTARQQDAILKVVPNAGHIVNIDAALAFNELAIPFLQEVHQKNSAPEHSTRPVPPDQ